MLIKTEKYGSASTSGKKKNVDRLAQIAMVVPR